MPEIMKYACGSLRQMAGRGIELDLETGRDCMNPPCSSWNGRCFGWEIAGSRSPYGPLLKTRWTLSP